MKGMSEGLLKKYIDAYGLCDLEGMSIFNGKK